MGGVLKFIDPLSAHFMEKQKKDKKKQKKDNKRAAADRAEGEALANTAGRSLLGDSSLGGSLLTGRPGGVGGGTLLGG